MSQNYNNENDFKYIVQDFSSFQLGSRFTYAEILENDRVPFKFQSIVRLYLLKEAGQDQEIGEHLLSIKEDDFCYHVFCQLKAKIKFYEPKENGGFTQKSLAFRDFITYKNNSWKEESLIHEISFSNLALMTFTV